MAQTRKRICLSCSKEFYPVNGSQKYCTKCRLVDAHLTLTKRKTLPRRDWELPGILTMGYEQWKKATESES